VGQDQNPASDLALSTTGLGYSAASRLLEVKPASLNIVQSNTTIEGAVKGNLIVDSDPDSQFKEMIVSFLVEPTEARAYYTGTPGEMNRTPENLQCFSRAVIYGPDGRTEIGTPDDKARDPQALRCGDSCPRASWKEYREKAKNNQATKLDIPPCDSYYKATLIDNILKMPMQLYVRSQSKQPFEFGLEKVARKLALMKAMSGKMPNIFDVKFKLSTKQVTKGKFTFYVLNLSEFSGVDESDKEAFGAIFQQYTAQVAAREAARLEQADTDKLVENSQSIDDAVLEGVYEDAPVTATATADLTQEIVL